MFVFPEPDVFPELDVLLLPGHNGSLLRTPRALFTVLAKKLRMEQAQGPQLLSHSVCLVH